MSAIGLLYAPYGLDVTVRIFQEAALLQELAATEVSPGSYQVEPILPDGFYTATFINNATSKKIGELSFTWVDGGSTTENPIIVDRQFTPEQRAKIRRYLGYSNQNELGDKGPSVQLLNDRLDDIYTEEFIIEVQSILAALDTLVEQQQASTGKSRIIKADVITFDYSTQAGLLDKIGKATLAELSAMMGVPILFNRFTAGLGTISMRSY